MNTKQQYKTAIQMAWPSVLESFFISLVGMIDTIMVGTLGSYAIAAIGLTTQPRLIGLTVFFGINIAVSSLVARRRGENDKRGANEVFLTATILALIACLILTFFMLFFANDFMRLAGSNNDTHLTAVRYFRIVMGGMIFNVIAMVINAAQRGSGNTKIAFKTNLISSILNITFNYLLIGGKLGFPALGVDGAALATVVGAFVAMVMSIRSLFNPRSLIQFKYLIDAKIKMRVETIKSIFKLGSTMVIENLAMRVGFVTTAVTAASLGTNEFAIYNAGMNLLSLGFSFGDGMQVAAVALSGQALGRNDRQEAINYGQICQRIGLMMSLMLSIFLLIFGSSIMSLYFKDPIIIQQATTVTRFIMIIVLLQISQLIYGGCLRAGGDVRFTLLAGIISVTVIRSLVTLISVHHFNLALHGIWIGILADQISRFTLLRYRFKKGYWTKIKI